MFKYVIELDDRYELSKDESYKCDQCNDYTWDRTFIKKNENEK